MTDMGRSLMYEAMEDQTISIAKAGIVAQLNNRCSVLDAANPKYGSFDNNSSVLEQINLPSTLLSRFDLIIMLQNKAEGGADVKVAGHIINSHILGSMAVRK